MSLNGDRSHTDSRLDSVRVSIFNVSDVGDVRIDVAITEWTGFVFQYVMKVLGFR